MEIHSEGIFDKLALCGSREIHHEGYDTSIALLDLGGLVIFLILELQTMFRRSGALKQTDISIFQGCLRISLKNQSCNVSLSVRNISSCYRLLLPFIIYLFIHLCVIFLHLGFIVASFLLHDVPLALSRCFVVTSSIHVASSHTIQSFSAIEDAQLRTPLDELHQGTYEAGRTAGYS